MRETSAQTLGMVIKHLDKCGVEGMVSVLLQLLAQEQWEVRHRVSHRVSHPGKHLPKPRARHESLRPITPWARRRRAILRSYDHHPFLKCRVRGTRNRQSCSAVQR